jgi:hypothetical protein
VRANPSGGAASAREHRELRTHRDLQRGAGCAARGTRTSPADLEVLVQYFIAHPELFLPLVVIALALAGVVQLGRWARAASRVVEARPVG